MRGKHRLQADEYTSRCRGESLKQHKTVKRSATRAKEENDVPEMCAAIYQSPAWSAEPIRFWPCAVVAPPPCKAPVGTKSMAFTLARSIKLETIRVHCTIRASAVPTELHFYRTTPINFRNSQTLKFRAHLISRILASCPVQIDGTVR